MSVKGDTFILLGVKGLKTLQVLATVRGKWYICIIWNYIFYLVNI